MHYKTNDEKSDKAAPLLFAEGAGAYTWNGETLPTSRWMTQDFGYFPLEVFTEARIPNVLGVVIFALYLLSGHFQPTSSPSPTNYANFPETKVNQVFKKIQLL